MAVIFALSSRPVPAAAAGLPDWIGHGAGYAVLGVLIARALDATSSFGALGRAAAAIALSTVYAVSDEVHRAAVPGRIADPWDVAKDVGGATLGAALWPALGRGAARPSGPA